MSEPLITVGAAIESWPKLQILCAGDVMLDRFIYGKARRISPEAPIPVLLVDHEEIMLGGAGNVVRNLTALGSRVTFISVTGDDSDGRAVDGMLDELPGCAATIVRDSTRRTSVKTRYLARNQQLLRVDAEQAAPVSEEILGRLLDAFCDALGSADLVILSDYAKGVLSGSHASRFIDACVAAGKPVFVDPKSLDFSLYRGASLIKPNVGELAAATRMNVHTEAAIETAALSLIADHGFGAVLATRGEAGMMLVRTGEPTCSFSSTAREVYDVSGAGDTVAAALALGAASGLDLAEASRIACVAAGIVVGKIGTATVTPAELIRELNVTSGVRFFSEDEALQRARLWKHTGLRVGFVSGDFSSLGPNEVLNLRSEKDKCDRLIVGTYDSNAATLLTALSCVDLVVSLGEGTSAAFARKLQSK